MGLIFGCVVVFGGMVGVVWECVLVFCCCYVGGFFIGLGGLVFFAFAVSVANGFCVCVCVCVCVKCVCVCVCVCVCEIELPSCRSDSVGGCDFRLQCKGVCNVHELASVITILCFQSNICLASFISMVTYDVYTVFNYIHYAY